MKNRLVEQKADSIGGRQLGEQWDLAMLLLKGWLQQNR